MGTVSREAGYGSFPGRISGAPLSHFSELLRLFYAFVCSRLSDAPLAFPASNYIDELQVQDTKTKVPSLVASLLVALLEGEREDEVQDS